MIEINELNNTSVLISSLDKIYNNAKIYGKFNSNNLYILNIIYNFINGCCLELNNSERIKLMQLYSCVYFNSEYICPASFIKSYEITPKYNFTQAESEDCNQFDSYSKIYYWQDNVLSNTVTQISPQLIINGFFNNKQFDTYENFIIGKNINYTNIGKICFALTNTLYTDTYKIYDILNNDVTNTFQRVYIDSLNIILFVSINNYSYNTMNLKIKKTTDIFDDGIFNNIFNTIFN